MPIPETNQRVRRVIALNVTFSLLSIIPAFFWAGCWYAVLYSFLAYEYPIRYDLDNPLPYLLYSSGVFSGIFLIMYFWGFSREFCRPFLQDSRPTVHSAKTTAEPQTPIAHPWKNPAGCLKRLERDAREDPVEFAFESTRYPLFLVPLLAHAFLYGYLVLGFWSPGEFP